jgi:hypothetical protein
MAVMRPENDRRDHIPHVHRYASVLSIKCRRRNGMRYSLRVLVWQLQLGDAAVRPGREVAISQRAHTEQGICLTLADTQGNSAQYIIDCACDIGGKHYVFLWHEESPDELLVARMPDKDHIQAMDLERFSSLKNALTMFLESNDKPGGQDVETLLGMKRH